MVTATRESQDNEHELLPPRDVEAEKAVLGSIALAPEVLDEVRAVIGPDCFYLPSHRMIFNAMEAMYEAGTKIDTVLLRDELQARGQLVDVGGVQGLLSIIQTVPHAAHAEYYAEIVREKWLRRELLRISNEITAKAYRDDIEPMESLNTAERLLCRLGDYETSDVVPISTALDEMLDDMYAKADMDEETPLHGQCVEWPLLRSYIDSWAETCVYVIAARPSQGKTALALQIAIHTAQAGTPVLMLSMEMPRVQLAQRVAGYMSGLDTKLIKNGQVQQNESTLGVLEFAIPKAKELPLRVYDSRISLHQLRGLVRKECRNHGVKMVIIDYLQLIDPEKTKRESTKNDQVSEISREIKLLANEMKIPIILLAQLNRDVERRDNKRPKLSDLRDSGAIEQDADVVFGFHRPDSYDSEDRPGMAELVLLKNRHGPIGEINLHMDKKTGRFTEWTERHARQNEEQF